MRIDELIKMLQEIQDERGIVDVELRDEFGNMTEVQDINVFNGDSIFDEPKVVIF